MLKSFCHQSFKKIRIKQKKIKPIDTCSSGLIDKRNKLVAEAGPVEELEETNKQIANFESDANRKKVIDNFKFYIENPANL